MAEHEPDEHELHMTFFEHLEELRARLIRSLVPFIPAFIAGWVMREELLSLLVIPLHQAGTHKLITISPVEMMVVYLKQSTIVAFLVSSPWVFYQAWGFIAPGLYAREKKLVLPFVFASTLCFSVGSLFAWFYIMPPTFEALAEFAGTLPGGTVEIEQSWTANEYVTFLYQMLFVFGITFEVPVVIVFLSLSGIVHYKQLVKFGRWWLVVSSVLAALLTPTQDALSMLLLLVPLVGLYYVAVALAYVIDLRRDKRQAAAAA
jgi:sec-independent protein translocase protein TatC